MAGGASYLAFYVSCFGFVAFAGLVALVLYAWGRREERKREQKLQERLRRRLQEQQNGEQEPEEHPRRLDPTSGDG